MKLIGTQNPTLERIGTDPELEQIRTNPREIGTRGFLKLKEIGERLIGAWNRRELEVWSLGRPVQYSGKLAFKALQAETISSSMI